MGALLFPFSLIQYLIKDLEENLAIDVIISNGLVMCQRVELKEIYKMISLDYPDKVTIKHLTQEREHFLYCEVHFE